MMTTTTPGTRWEVTAHLGKLGTRKHIIRGACREDVFTKMRRAYPGYSAAQIKARPVEQVVAENGLSRETAQQRSARIRREILDSIGTEEAAASHIAERHNLHRETVARHIAALVQDGLVEYVQRGSGSKPMTVRRVKA